MFQGQRFGSCLIAECIRGSNLALPFLPNSPQQKLHLGVADHFVFQVLTGVAGLKKVSHFRMQVICQKREFWQHCDGWFSGVAIWHNKVYILESIQDCVRNGRLLVFQQCVELGFVRGIQGSSNILGYIYLANWVLSGVA